MPSNDGDKPTTSTSLSLTEDRLDEWRSEADKMSMNFSEYIRSMVAAGRRQVAELEPGADSSSEGSIRHIILEELPSEESEAIDPKDLIENVLGPQREEIYDLLDEDNQIKSSARHGGYYKE